MRHKIFSVTRPMTATILISFLILSCPLYNSVRAADGDSDPTFGDGGKVTTNFPVIVGARPTIDQVSDIAIQPDGKIIAVGVSNNSDFALARYDQDGSLDSTFGSGGRVTTDFSGNNDWASGVALQPDGRIVAGGISSPKTFPFNADFALARYNPDGSLDASFGVGGRVTTDWFGNMDDISDIVLQPDGKIVAVGTTLVSLGPLNPNHDVAVARYNSDGSLDLGFGAAGKASTDYFGHLDQAFQVALQPDGKIVTAGYALVGANYDFAVTRYNADGIIDSSFGSGGKVTTDFLGGEDLSRGIAIQANGKIVLAGHAYDPGTAKFDFALARYNADGSLDSTFGSGGRVATASAGASNSAHAMSLQSDGKIVVAGIRTQSQVVDDFAVVRYNTDGSIDSDFGGGRPVITDFFGNRDVAEAVVVQSDGHIIAGGIARTAALDDDFALARYDVSGKPQPAFTLGLSSLEVTADRGTSVGITVNIARTGGFEGRVTVTPPDTSDLRIKLNPSDSVSTTEGSVKFKFKIKARAPAGPHEITFTGRDDSGRTHTASLTLIVR